MTDTDKAVNTIITALNQKYGHTISHTEGITPTVITASTLEAYTDAILALKDAGIQLNAASAEHMHWVDYDLYQINTQD